MVAGLTDDSLAEKLLDLALKSGAEAAEVLQSRSQSRPVFFEANRLKQLESSAALGTALRLWVNGRPGLAVAYGPVDPQPIVDKAMAISALNDFHVSYTLSAYTAAPNQMPLIYSALHQNIQDHCNAAAIEILSPGYTALRDGNQSTSPADYLPKDYTAPAFGIQSQPPHAL